MKFRSWMLTASLTLIGTSLFAQKEAHELEFTTDQVVVFKDGYGMFFKTGKAIADEEGKVLTYKVPNAVLGSFWAYSADDAPISMTAEIKNIQQPQKVTPARHIVDLLRSNIGKEMTIIQKENQRIEGVLSSVLGENSDARSIDYDQAYSIPHEAQNSLEDNYYSSRGSYFTHVPSPTLAPRPLAKPNSKLFSITLDDGTMQILSSESVEQLLGKDLNLNAPDRTPESIRGKVLTVDFGEEYAGKEVEINLMYMAEGIRWIPTYRLAGELDESASMTLQGELLNDVEDIENAKLSLVVGVPNFKFKDRVSPLSLEQEIRNVLSNAGGRFDNRIVTNTLSNGMMSQVSYQQNSNNSTEQNGDWDTSLGQRSQDLFFYDLDSFTIQKGARASLPIWTSKVPLEHTYQFTVEPQRSESGYHYRSRDNQNINAQSSPLSIELNKVWHILELKNKGSIPWTTGPAFVLQNSLPISQDLLTYTPAGSVGNLPLTIAVDVRGNHQESEIGRANNSIRIDGTYYTRITKKGEITMKNYRHETSPIKLELKTGGQIKQVSDDGIFTINDFNSEDWGYNYHNSNVNQHSEVDWEFTLEPGEEKTVTYTLEYLTR